MKKLYLVTVEFSESFDTLSLPRKIHVVSEEFGSVKDRVANFIINNTNVSYEIESIVFVGNVLV